MRVECRHSGISRLILEEDFVENFEIPYMKLYSEF